MSSYAIRVPRGDGWWQWTGHADGVSVEYLTADPELQLSAEPIGSERLRGVALIDRFEAVHAATAARRLGRRVEIAESS